MGKGVAENYTSAYAGIDYIVYPNPNNVLTQNTVYMFNINLSSSSYTITNCEYNLYHPNGTLIHAVVPTFNSTNCEGRISFDVATYNWITQKMFYTVEGEQATVSFTYYNPSQTKGNFTLKDALTNTGNFRGAGFDNYALSLVAFILIFGITAWVASSLGFVEPEQIMIIITVLTGLFSYFDWLHIAYNAPHTIFTEFVTQYGIFGLMVMMVLGYFFWRNQNG